METLYIIGNGFDIYHGLPTKFAHFHHQIIESNTDLENQFEEYFTFRTDADYLWSDFESDLATFSYKSFFNEYNHSDPMSESYSPSEAFGVEDEITQEAEKLVQHIQDSFRDWIECIEMPEEFPDSIKPLNLSRTARFLNFNYTATLEALYQIPREQILYIHNKAEEYRGELIFGHRESEESIPRPYDLDEDGNSNRTPFTRAEDAARSIFYEFRKPTEEVIKEHEAFFKGLLDIKYIKVLGHSIAEVDWPYFQLITQCTVNAEWTITYYGQQDLEDKQKLASRMLSFAPNKIELIKFSDF